MGKMGKVAQDERSPIQSIEGSFQRLSTGKTENYRLPLAGFAVSHLYVKPLSNRRKVRRQWWRIKRKKTNRCIYRTLSFHPPLKTEKWVLASEAEPEDNSEIILDWDGWVDLLEDNEKAEECLELSITLVRWWQVIQRAKCLWRHPEPTHRLTNRLGLLSLGLGILSIVLTLLLAGTPLNSRSHEASPQGPCPITESETTSGRGEGK